MADTRIGDVGRLAWFPSSKVTKWFVVIFWLAVLAAAFGPAGKLQGALNNEAVAWLPADAQSTKVVNQIEAFQSKNEFPAVIVYERAAGLSPQDTGAVTAQVAKFNALEPVKSETVGPIPAQDGKALQVIVPVDAGDGGWDTLGDTVTELRAIADQRPDGLTMHITGPVGYAADSSEAFSGIDGKLLYSAMAVVIVILLLTYRSPILWLLPVVSAGIALTSAQAIIYLLAAHAGLTVNAQSAGILTVLVFGAGTDYALLLVARYREELRKHEDRHQAMALALHRAGPAIIASASTVAISMLVLLLAEMNSTKGLGPVAAIGVGIALIAMMTLLPALLVICGRWVFWPKRPSYGSVEPTVTGFWARMGGGIARRPRRVWIGTALVLGAMSIAILDLNANGLSNADSFRNHPDSVVGEQVLARHFPAGSGTPVVVISTAAQATQVRDAVAATPGIAAVNDPVVRGGRADIEATMTAAPDSQQGYDVVQRVRDRVHTVAGAGAKVGGTTAINLDVQRAAHHDRDLIIPIVLLVVFVILALLLRAVLAPLILIATVVLSFGAALGVSGLFFNHVFGFGGADTGLPLFVFVFLVALGIDYNIFLMTRLREEALKHGTRAGAITGLGATGGVITSAGLVLAGTFAVLGTLPLTGFAEIGFAVAFGVLLDTLIVRSVLVTALNLDIGDRMWWPSALARREPPVADDVAREESVAVS
jgi:RND superfamily putative drug exporter